MVNTRSTDSGLLTNPVPLETQVANLTTSVNQITQMLHALQDRLNNGEGTSQRRDNGGQTGQNGGTNGGAYGRLTKIEFPKFEGDQIRLVSMHMFRKELNWHKHFMAKFGEVVTWDVYQTKVKKRFESVFEDPIVALKNLK
ncbi:hypothetical protein Tco_1027748 [Tanacetum coccineum]